MSIYVTNLGFDWYLRCILAAVHEEMKTVFYCESIL